MRRFLGWVVTVAACGPNYRYAYEGEGAFERCYALDYDGSTPPEARQQCWAAWLQSYAFGASVDRVEYARSRIASTPSTPNSGPPTQAPRDNAAAPSPITPPPSTAPSESPARAWERAQLSAGGIAVTAPPPTAQASVPTPEPPGHACATLCHERWRTCGGACATGQTVCLARCDDSYRDCMRGCY